MAEHDFGGEGTRTAVKDSDGAGASNDSIQIAAISPAFLAAAARAKAAKTAKDTEQSAVANPISTIAGGADAAKSAEQNQPFANNVQGIDLGNKKTSKKGSFLKKGPLVAIVALLLGGGGLMAGGSSLFPFHLQEQIIELFDGSYSSRSARMPYLAKWVFNIENDETAMVKNYSSVFSASSGQKYRYVLPSKVKRLEAQGVSFLEKGSTIPDGMQLPKGTTLELEGRQITLEYDMVMGNASSRTMIGDATLSNRVMVYDTGDAPPTLVAANKYGEIYESDGKFRGDVNRGSRTFVGRIAAWMDLSVARFLNNHSITRNVFGKWINKVFDAEGADTKFGQIMKGLRPQKPQELKISGTSSGEVTDMEGDGTVTTRETSITETADAASGNMKAQTAAMLTNIGQAVTNLSCGVMVINATAKVIKAGIAIHNATQYIAGILEATSKVKAGDGAGSPINAAATDFMRTDSDGNAAVGAEGMQVILSGGKYSPNRNDPSVIKTSIESVVGGISATIGAAVGCAVAKMVLATASFVLNFFTTGAFSVGKVALGIAGGLVFAKIAEEVTESIMENVTTDFCTDTVGLDRGSCAALGANAYVSGNFRAGGGSLGGVAQYSAYYDAQSVILAREAAEDRASRSPFDISTSHTFLGSIAGSILPHIGRVSSLTGIISTIGTTFTGALSALSPAASAIDKTNYVQNMIGNCPNLAGIGAVGDIHCQPLIMTDLSTMQLDPEQQALDLFKKGRKVGLSWTDAQGDHSPIITAEGTMTVYYADGSEIDAIFVKSGDQIHTADGSPITIRNINDGQLMVDDDGNEEINPDSTLAKYIMYCSERQSPFGIVDQNITSQETRWTSLKTSNTTFNTIANSLLNAIPGVGDAITIAEASQAIVALPWATGANCVARDDTVNHLKEAALSADYDPGEGGEEVKSQVTDSALAVINPIPWSEMKEYQRYVEDDRIIQSTNPEVKSAVTAFLDDYYEKNPLDTSFEGVLARQTGLTKENVIAALDEMEYQNFIAQYDPTDLYPIPADHTEVPLVDQLPSAIIADHHTAPTPVVIIYADTRNRTHTV